MTITLLFIGASIIGISAVAVMTAVRNAEPVLATDNTAVGLGNATVDTLASNGGRMNRVASDWQLTAVDNLTHAEELLDSLENQGYEDRELVVMGNSSFAVRWR
jgi:hypothetical protein